MLIRGFTAGAWGTNCYVVAPAAGEQCVIIDPGHEAAPGVEEIVREHRLQPVAVLLTHGHIDHVFSVVPVCGAHDVPAWIHPEDRGMITEPERALNSAIGRRLFGDMVFTEPDDLRELTDGAVLELAGMRFVVDHTPGHTRGSVTFTTAAEAAGDRSIPPVLYAGDLLFAGSIGRTDLPGGDYGTILRSLARTCLPLPDETVVLAGHGPTTTIGQERATNPYLAEAAPLAAPHRGM